MSHINETPQKATDKQLIEYLRQLAFDRGRDDMGRSDPYIEEAAKRFEMYSQMEEHKKGRSKK